MAAPKSATGCLSPSSLVSSKPASTQAWSPPFRMRTSFTPAYSMMNAQRNAPRCPALLPGNGSSLSGKENRPYKTTVVSWAMPSCWSASRSSAGERRFHVSGASRSSVFRSTAPGMCPSS